MGKRLQKMSPGEQCVFLCEKRMAKSIHKPIICAGGEITAQDVRSYGVVITMRRK